jgi:putative ABC transport system permease protein
VVDLPAGLHGRPPLQVDQVWYHTDTSTTVRAGLDADTAFLSGLDLIGGELLMLVCTSGLMRGRRAELATLRALGWPRWRLGRQLLAEFALTGAVAVAGAGLAGYAIGTALGGRPPWAWLLIAALAMIALILVEKRRPLLRGFTIAVACAAVSLELAARWAFPGADGSWAGRSLSWQGTVVDIAAVLVTVTMATFSVTDLDLATLRERALEIRTLRAMGWPARDLTRLTLRKAVRPGLAAGLAVGAFDLVGAMAVAGSAPPRLFALVAFTVAAGVAMSVLAAGVSATFSRRRDSANN